MLKSINFEEKKIKKIKNKKNKNKNIILKQQIY